MYKTIKLLIRIPWAVMMLVLFPLFVMIAVMQEDNWEDFKGTMTDVYWGMLILGR